jgi:segregation and condensation protein B
MPLASLIEGVLFYTGAPQKKSKLMGMFGVEQNALAVAVEELKNRLAVGGVRLLETELELQLVTAPEMSEFIAELRKGELSQDIGKAGAETLAIVLYREPISRGEIDRIRGVNSAFILRNLMTRGLIERTALKNSHQFRTTPALLQHLGVTHKHDLPHFGEFMDSIDAFSEQPDTV